MAKILVVEDDHSTQMLIASALEKEGHKVTICEDGHEALLVVDREQPDLLISDINLPGMDGYALVRELRMNPQWLELPIIFLSSLTQRANIRVGMSTGADDYLTKPFSVRELRDAVYSQLRKRETLRGVHSAAIEMAVERTREEVSKEYEHRLHATFQQLWSDSAPQNGWRPMQAVVLRVGIKQYLRYSEVMNPDDIGQMMHLYFESMLDAVELFDPSAVRLANTGIMAVYVDGESGSSVSKEQRVLKAASACMTSATRLRLIFESKLSALGLPPLEICAAMHSGGAVMLGVSSVANPKVISVPLGDAINVTQEIYRKMSPQWKVTCSRDLAERLGANVKMGEEKVIDVPPRQQSLAVCEVMFSGRFA